jgi:hypothetical protein
MRLFWTIFALAGLVGLGFALIERQEGATSQFTITAIEGGRADFSVYRRTEGKIIATAWFPRSEFPEQTIEPKYFSMRNFPNDPVQIQLQVNDQRPILYNSEVASSFSGSSVGWELRPHHENEDEKRYLPYKIQYAELRAGWNDVSVVVTRAAPEIAGKAFVVALRAPGRTAVSLLPLILTITYIVTGLLGFVFELRSRLQKREA